MQIGHTLESLALDLRFGARMWTRHRAIAVMTVTILALGISANTAIFTLVNAFIFRPLPYEDPGRLVHLYQIDNVQGWDQVRSPHRQYLDWQKELTSFTDLASYNYGAYNLTDDGGEPEQTMAGRLTANLLPLLGVKPILGRGFLAGEDRPGSDQVALLGYGLWQRRYAGSEDVIGKTVHLDGDPYTVVGVMERGFRFPFPEVKLWIPRVIDREDAGSNLMIVGRLAPGVNEAAAQAELETVHARLAQEYPDADGRYGVHFMPLKKALLFFYDVIRGVMLLMMVAVGFVLTIVAANVANLMLARAGARATEIAVRSSLGAGRRRLLRQMLTESAILALVAGSLGSALAYVGVGKLAPHMPDALFHVGEIQVDTAALVFTLTVSLLTAAFFGLMPALRSTRVELTEALKEGGRAGSDGRGRLRSALVVAQISLAVLLLCGAVTTLTSARDMQHVDLGFAPSSTLTVSFTLPENDYPTQAERSVFLSTVRERLQGLPGVEHAGAVANLPLNFAISSIAYALPGEEASKPEERRLAHSNRVTPGFFDALGAPLLKGRDFESTDVADGNPVAILSQSLAERIWSKENPLGRSLVLGDEGRRKTVTVVGVAPNVRDEAAWSVGEIAPQVYIPETQSSLGAGFLVVRASGDPMALLPQVKSEVRRLSADLPLAQPRSMERVVTESVGPVQAAAAALGLFSLAAMLLAAIGIYAVVAYTVSRRAREFGVRMALGADGGSIVALVLRQGLGFTVAGTAVGLAAAFGLTQVMASFLAGVEADALGFALVAVVLAATSLFASYLPARRAASFDPVTVLRQD